MRGYIFHADFGYSVSQVPSALTSQDLNGQAPIAHQPSLHRLYHRPAHAKRTGKLAILVDRIAQYQESDLS